MVKNQYNFDDLREIMKKLRKECPWDKEQTHKSIKMNFIEEVYEACEAIEHANTENLKEELGDVLLQIVFHSEIADEKGEFDVDDVINDICKKLIYRHPHIFSDVKVKNVDEVWANWDALKKIEKKQISPKDPLLAVPKNYPSLLRAAKVLKKARKEDLDSLERKNILDLASDIDNDDSKICELIFELLKISNEKDIILEDELHRYCNKYIENL